MLDMGFEPWIHKIVERMEMPLPRSRPTMLLSATFPTCFDSSFCGDKERSRCIKCWLSRNGFPAIAICGDKVQREREQALKSFKNGTSPILVATDIASCGLDIPPVAHVINFDLPKDIDDCVHSTGRTGRAGKSGLATAFFCDKNLPLAKALIELMQESNQEAPSWLNELAERSTSVGQGKHYGASRFGGYDCRNAESRSVNYNYPSNNEGTDSSLLLDPFMVLLMLVVECYVAANADSYAPCGYRDGYESIVAIGWD